MSSVVTFTHSHMKRSHDNPQAGLPVPANPEWRIGIVYSDFYKEEIETMISYARKALLESGVRAEHISLHPASGSFEIPLLGAALAQKKSVDALIGLGIIVEGETEHARLVAENTVRGIMDIQVRYAVPFACEVLYVSAMHVATERLNKGVYAAHCVLHSLAQLEGMRS